MLVRVVEDEEGGWVAPRPLGSGIPVEFACRPEAVVAPVFSLILAFFALFHFCPGFGEFLFVPRNFPVIWCNTIQYRLNPCLLGSVLIAYFNWVNTGGFDVSIP